jgi:CheY-like chemotaxis protein/anti-sigma regulatory factor (Ser/Thr protein kinase)
MATALEVIERNARAQARLLDDLLDVSRIIAGKTQLNLRPIPPGDPLRAAVDSLRPAAEQKGIVLLVEPIASEDALMADADRIQQVIGNLLANAVKFTPSGGTIAVTASVTNGFLEVKIADSGVGIEPEFLPFVFERFRQASTARRRESGGLGLGLWIVKHLVELHGGVVTMDSAGAGTGTTARVRLPLASGGSAVADVQSQTPVGKRLHGRFMLVIDDDADARMLLEHVLAGQGARVSVAASAREGLAAAAFSSPDVILVDLALPIEDGFTLVGRLRAYESERHRRTPVVALTADARAADVNRCLAAGFDAVIATPIQIAELVNVVAGLVSSTKARVQQA